MKASLVIPLYNNEKTARKQLLACEQIMKQVCADYEIIVCDDKSTDNSAEVLNKFFGKRKKCILLFHPKNLGIAKTLKELYKKARYPYVVLFSVDGDWNPRDVGRLLKAAKKENADIVIGKRAYKKYSLYRKSVSFFYNFLPYFLFRVKTIDAGSIKVFKKSLYRSTTIISKNVFFEAEFIIRSGKLRRKIISIPISFNKQKDNKGLGGKVSWVIGSCIDLIQLRFRL